MFVLRCLVVDFDLIRFDVAWILFGSMCVASLSSCVCVYFEVMRFVFYFLFVRCCGSLCFLL